MYITAPWHVGRPRLSFGPCPPAEKTALADVLNVLTYHDALATERGGYLIRQWVASSLYDRIRCAAERVEVNSTGGSSTRLLIYTFSLLACFDTSTRPFLSLIEKKWIVFQMLSALRDIHARKVGGTFEPTGAHGKRADTLSLFTHRYLTGTSSRRISS